MEEDEEGVEDDDDGDEAEAEDRLEDEWLCFGV